MPDREWDGEGNAAEAPDGPVGPIGPGDGLAIGAVGTNMYTGRSGYATWVTATGVQETNASEWTISYDTINGMSGVNAARYASNPVVTIANEERKSEEIEIHPVHQITNNGNRFIQPIKYTFNNQSWRYTLAYACSVFFGPWLIIFSKIAGRSTGFRIKNRRWL